MVVFYGRVVVLVRMGGRHVFPLSTVPQVMHQVSVLVCVNDGVMGVRYGLLLVTYRAPEPAPAPDRTPLAMASPDWHVASAERWQPRNPSVRPAGPMTPGTLVTPDEATVPTVLSLAISAAYPLRTAAHGAPARPAHCSFARRYLAPAAAVLGYGIGAAPVPRARDRYTTGEKGGGAPSYLGSLRAFLSTSHRGRLAGRVEALQVTALSPGPGSGPGSGGGSGRGCGSGGGAGPGPGSGSGSGSGGGSGCGPGAGGGVGGSGHGLGGGHGCGAGCGGRGGGCGTGGGSADPGHAGSGRSGSGGAGSPDASPMGTTGARKGSAGIWR